MIAETMTRSERVQAAIRLEKTDRTPVVPYISYVYCLRYQGMTQAEGFRNRDKVPQAIRDTFDALGGYDAAWRPGWGPGVDWSPLVGPMRFKMPGRDLPEEAVFQADEQELMTVEDYDRLIEIGWRRFAVELYSRIWGRSPSEVAERRERSLMQYTRDMKTWEGKGVPIGIGSTVMTPLMALSCSRSMIQFPLDLYRRPDKVAAAMDAMVDDLINETIAMTRRTGVPRVETVLERGSGFYYPLKLCEWFEFPYLKKMAEAFVAEGITPILHFDTDWTINLPYLKELPRGKCVCELDGTTDIFKAEEILRDHMCIMGDVPASLLSLGTKQAVEDYSRKLIDIVGAGGGFILSTGCECPIDAKFENVKMMIDTAKTYVP